MRDRLEMTQMARLAWPATLSFLSFSLMEVVDCAMLGLVGVESMGGASLAGTVLYLVMAFPIFALRAVAPITATQLGRGNSGSLFVLVRIVGLTSLFLGLLATAVTLSATFALPWFGYEPELVGSAQSFLFWRAPCIGLDLLFIGGWHILDGMGDTRSPLVAGIVTNVTNGVFNLLLIPGLGGLPALGVTGAALATNLAMVVGLLLIAAAIRRRNRQLTLAKDRMVPPGNNRYSAQTHVAGRPVVAKTLVRSFVRMGWPLGLTGLIDVTGIVVLGLLIARAGSVAVATHGILGRLITLGLASASGLGVAVVTLVARSIGARDGRTARHRARLAILLQLAMGFALGFLTWAAGDHCLLIFTRDPEVLALGSRLLLATITILFVDGLLSVTGSILEGRGQMRILLGASVLFDLALAGVCFLFLRAESGLDAFYLVWAGKSILKFGFLLGKLSAWLLTERNPKVSCAGPRTWVSDTDLQPGDRLLKPKPESHKWLNAQVIRAIWWSVPPPYG